MKKNKSKINFLISERLGIFNDFTIALTHMICDFYVDKDSLDNDEDVTNHYNWCYNRTCKIFQNEEIDFSDNDDLRNYFYSYYYERFYFADEQDEKLHYINFWTNIFTNSTSTEIITVLKELYEVFNYSIEKKLQEIEKNIVYN